MMKQKARWLVTLFVVCGIVAGSLVPGLAASPDDLSRLVLENRLAEMIANLNLTQDQTEQLKEVAKSFRAAQDVRMAELAELLSRRRDALLDKDQPTLRDVNAALQELLRQPPLTLDENAAEFLKGLTERQIQVLGQLLPGITRGEMIVHMRMQERGLANPSDRWRYMPAPNSGNHQRRSPEIMMFTAPNGLNLEVMDILIDLLDR